MAAATRPDGKRTIPQIQRLRGVAATMVMLLHSGDHHDPVLHRTANFFSEGLGYLGVALFFAISGYLMSVAIRVQTPAVFLAHRVVRIYPLLIIVTLCIGAIAPVMGYHRPVDFGTFPLMPLPGLAPYFFVEWTLICEVVFYVCLYLVAVAGGARHIHLVALVWLCVILGINAISPDNKPRLLMPVYQLLVAPVSLPFAGGLLLPWLVRRQVPAWFPFGLGTVALLLIQYGVRDYSTGSLLFGTSAVLLLWSAIAIPPASRLLRPGVASRLLGRWGDYSYGLYLSHVTIIRVIYRLCGDWPFWRAWCLAVLCAGVAGVVFGQLDLSLYRRLKQALRGVNPAMLQRAMVAYCVLYVAGSLHGAIGYYFDDRNEREIVARAMQLQSAGPIGTPAGARIAAQQLGWRGDADIVGRVEAIRYDAAQSELLVDLWAADLHGKAPDLHVALYRNGELLAVRGPETTRKDIARTLKLPRGVKAGFHFERAEPACDTDRIVAVAFTRDGRYDVLPDQGTSPICQP